MKRHLLNYKKWYTLIFSCLLIQYPINLGRGNVDSFRVKPSFASNISDGVFLFGCWVNPGEISFNNKGLIFGSSIFQFSRFFLLLTIIQLIIVLVLTQSNIIMQKFLYQNNSLICLQWRRGSNSKSHKDSKTNNLKSKFLVTKMYSSLILIHSWQLKEGLLMQISCYRHLLSSRGFQGSCPC